jgi:integrase
MQKIYKDHCSIEPKNVSSTGIPLGYHVCDFGYFDYVHIDLQGIKETKEERENRIKEEKYKYVDYAERTYRGLLYKVSLEVLGKRINPHIFRHARAQYLMNKGLGIEFIKSFLGHSSLTSTEIYAQASPELLKREMKRIREMENNV